jgi:hypothetical protein
MRWPFMLKSTSERLVEAAPEFHRRMAKAYQDVLYRKFSDHPIIIIDPVPEGDWAVESHGQLGHTLLGTRGSISYDNIHVFPEEL